MTSVKVYLVNLLSSVMIRCERCLLYDHISSPGLSGLRLHLVDPALVDVHRVRLDV